MRGLYSQIGVVVQESLGANIVRTAIYGHNIFSLDKRLSREYSLFVDWFFDTQACGKGKQYENKNSVRPPHSRR